MNKIDNTNNRNNFNNIYLNDSGKSNIENKILEHVEKKLEQERDLSKKINLEIICEVREELSDFLNEKGDN